MVREAGTHKEVLGRRGVRGTERFLGVRAGLFTHQRAGRNIEFLMFVRKSDAPALCPKPRREWVVQAAHSALDA